MISLVDRRLQEWRVIPTIKRSAFIEHVAVRLLRQRWAREIGPAPRSRTPLLPHDAAQAEAWIDAEFRVDMMDAEATTAHIHALAWAAADARAVDMRRGPLSERIAIRVGQRMARGQPRGNAWRLTTTDEIVAALSTQRAMPTEQFAEKYGPVYDHAWDKVGCENTRAHPPSEMALGPDRRPTLLRTGPVNRRRDWSLGTGRDVYSRYALHFDARAQPAALDCSRQECASPALSLDTDPGQSEAQRAASVYGLAFTQHHVALRSVSAGLSEVPHSGGWRRWEEFLSPCYGIDESQEEDSNIVDGVQSAMASWTFSGVGAPLVKTYGIGTLQGLLQKTAVRKFWMAAHRYERHNQGALRTCELVRTMRTALYTTFPPSIHRWLDGIYADPSPRETWAPCPHSEEVELPDPGEQDTQTGRRASLEESTMVARINDTYLLLEHHPELVEMLIRDGKNLDPDVWSSTYDQALATAAGQPLMHTEALDLLKELRKEGLKQAENDTNSQDKERF